MTICQVQPHGLRHRRLKDIQHTWEKYGDIRIDDYFWLRERDNPAVIAHLEAENAHTAAAMAHTQGLQDVLYAEMRARIKEDDSTVPERVDDYFYYRRTEANRQYPLYCRKAVHADAPEEVLLDVNDLSVGHEYTRVGAFAISPDHRLLAYTVDHAGDEQYTICIKELSSGEHLSDTIPDAYYGLEWGNDNVSLFYTVIDHATRPYKLFRHRLGDKVANDALIFHEQDESYSLTLRKSKSQDFLFIHLGSSVTDEEWFIDANQPGTAPTLIEARRHGVNYRTAHHGDSFFVVTNDGDAKDFRVMCAPVVQPGRDHWREVIPHRPGVKIDRVEPFSEFLVVHLRENGLRGLRVIRLTNGDDLGAAHTITFPEPVYTYRPHANPDFNSDLLRFTYSSPTSPDCVYDYDLKTRERELRKEEEIFGYNSSDYVAERLWATAGDGERVPISLVRRRDVVLDGNNPALLYGYGSYGATIDPGFDAKRISLLDRGFVFALAHIRGGGAMGRPWYEDGKLQRKKNTFTDFIACAEHLIVFGYTEAAQLTIMGRSAGGLLMGAVVNMRPDLFAGVVAGVPFVDVINTMLDPSIPLTIAEYEEWGKPDRPDDYAYMRSYSPYDNVESTAYPHILATAGLNDPRVQYWEPAKWIAKLRTANVLAASDGSKSANQLLLKTNMAAGHGGASGRFDYLEEVAFEYAFLIDVVQNGDS